MIFLNTTLLFVDLSKPTVSTNIKDNGEVLAGEIVILKCNSSESNVHMTWEDEYGNEISKSPLFVLNVTKTDTGKYRCKSMRENTMKYSDLIPIQVKCKF